MNLFRQILTAALPLSGLCIVLFATAGCSRPGNVRVQGYVEGEFVYVASPLSGPLQKLDVQRGDRVTNGQPLFTLDDTVESAVLDLERASLTFTQRDFERQTQLGLTPGASPVRDLEMATNMRDQDAERVAQAAWNYHEKHQVAPQSALVFDTLYRVGEWVDAGHPVVELLPPENIEVRAFVPEQQVGLIQPGDEARVFVDGINQPFIGHLEYIFPDAEYTPPVIYSQDTRTKLVYMVEVTFAPDVAVKLHPGQPVDVEFQATHEH